MLRKEQAVGCDSFKEVTKINNRTDLLSSFSINIFSLYTKRKFTTLQINVHFQIDTLYGYFEKTQTVREG